MIRSVGIGHDAGHRPFPTAQDGSRPNRLSRGRDDRSRLDQVALSRTLFGGRCTGRHMIVGLSMRRWGLTATFAAVSLLAMAAVGTLLVLAIGNQAREYALDGAIRTARAYMTAGVVDVAPVDNLTGRAELVPGSDLRSRPLLTFRMMR